MSSSNITESSRATGISEQPERSAGYSAPYRQNESPYDDHYIIAFKAGYTLDKHFAFVGKVFDIEGTLDEGYYAKLDRALFDNVRRDPGVELIEDNVLGTSLVDMDPSEEYLEQISREEEAEKQRASAKHTGYQVPYNRAESPYRDHYIVAFRPGHSLAAHFALVGREFEIEATLNEGYYAKLDRELFGLVRQDPGVRLVEEDGLGEFGPTEAELEQSRLADEEDRDVHSPDPSNAQTVIPLDQIGATEYQAPYNRLAGYPYKDYYTVGLKPGHDMAKHFAFLGKSFDIQVGSDTLYYAKLEPELFETVRRDPGVEMVEDDPLEGEEGGSFGPTEEELEEARVADEEKERATEGT
ncbi:hypothetical protein B0A48_13529 [Cryoendolithus antarcticus]|uniref:Uncharacterized protein n=1 Tax=Cryoendolithus antarcticus TaxID=1507870 RepID=A0A1V8SPL7_9PEZI|nr:hypothetical protein B0A48_13529 [Cryoendolithus antarcticus]